MNWKGVMPAITTAFDANLKVDTAFIAQHSRWMLECGCTAIIPLGSLGEGATLAHEEKLQVIEACVQGAGGKAPVAAAISALSTAEAVKLAKAAADKGCQGLMVLPPYVYLGDWREMKAHLSAVIKATRLSCMLYNNPVSYVTDFLPEQIAELAAEHSNLHAVKESSADVRRVTAIRALIGDRLAISVGSGRPDPGRHRRRRGRLGGGFGKCAAARIREAFRIWRPRRNAKSVRTVSLVPPAASNGYGAEVRAIDQAGTARGRQRQRTREAAAHGGDRQGTGRGASDRA